MGEFISVLDLGEGPEEIRSFYELREQVPTWTYCSVISSHVHIGLLFRLSCHCVSSPLV